MSGTCTAVILIGRYRLIVCICHSDTCRDGHYNWNITSNNNSTSLARSYWSNSYIRNHCYSNAESNNLIGLCLLELKTVSSIEKIFFSKCQCILSCVSRSLNSNSPVAPEVVVSDPFLPLRPVEVDLSVDSEPVLL